MPFRNGSRVGNRFGFGFVWSVTVATSITIVIAAAITIASAVTTPVCTFVPAAVLATSAATTTAAYAVVNDVTIITSSKALSVGLWVAPSIVLLARASKHDVGCKRHVCGGRELRN